MHLEGVDRAMLIFLALGALALGVLFWWLHVILA